MFFKATWARREKNRKENHVTKVTKIPKTKRRKYGINGTIIVDFSNSCNIRNSFAFLTRKVKKTSSHTHLKKMQYQLKTQKIINAPSQKFSP